MANLLLITGAAGFVGSHAVNFALESRKYDFVLATDILSLSEFLNKHHHHLDALIEGKRFRYIKADLTDMREVSALIHALREHYRDYNIFVWHIGGCFDYSASRETLYKVNVLGTRNLLDCLADFPALAWLKRFVFWGSGSAYGDFNHPDGQLPADENYPVRPQTDYGWSKKEAEDQVIFFRQLLKFPTTIMRMAAIYGPGSRYGMANAFFLNASGQVPPLICGNPRNKVALVHVEDVIRAAGFLSHCREANGEIYNVVDDSLYTLKDVSLFIGERLNNKPFANFHLPAWVLRYLIWRVSCSARFLGGKPVFDPELGNISLLNGWMSNRKLKALEDKYSGDIFCQELFRYSDSLKGLEATIAWYKGKGWL